MISIHVLDDMGIFFNVLVICRKVLKTMILGFFFINKLEKQRIYIKVMTFVFIENNVHVIKKYRL